MNMEDNDMRVKRIGVLTSGGDAPGMNPCVRAVVRTADVPWDRSIWYSTGMEWADLRRYYKIRRKECFSYD